VERKKSKTVGKEKEIVTGEKTELYALKRRGGR